MTFAKRRKGLSRLGDRLRGGKEARIAAFGGSLTYDGYYFASLGRTLTKAYTQAVVETATRGLPGFGCERAVFRTRSAADLNPDFVIVEFASEDARQPARHIGRAVEGIVRQLRAGDPDREMAFVYFGSTDELIAKWEAVADYYGIPSFDCNALARSLIDQGQAVLFERWPGRRTWDERRPIALLQFEGAHTTLGGTILGSSIAQSMITMFNPSSLVTESELPPPLDAGQYGDAVTIDASRLIGEGWLSGPLGDTLANTPIAVHFESASVAERAGAQIQVNFTGRAATIWTLGGGGAIKAALDGQVRILTPPADGRLHAENVLDEDENRRHVLDLEALTLPAVIAGLDVLGSLS